VNEEIRILLTIGYSKPNSSIHKKTLQ